KTLAHPLIAITIPADDVAPPLVSDFVWPDITPEGVRTAASSQQLSSLRGVDVRKVRHVHQCGPCLSEESGWLLRHRYSRVRKFSEKRVVDAYCILRIGESSVGDPCC